VRAAANIKRASVRDQQEVLLNELQSENAALRSELAKVKRENEALKREVVQAEQSAPVSPTASTRSSSPSVRIKGVRISTGPPPALAAPPAATGQTKREPVVVQAHNLRSMVEKIVEAAGSSEAEAQTVAANLVLSNLKGHDSHGVGYLPRYIKGCVAGLIQQDATAEVVSDAPTMVLLDGHVGFGQSLGKQAMALGIPKALEHGVAVVGIRNSHHLARIGAWAEQCADAGLISVHFTNVAGHDPLVAPHLGSDARLGTNPFTVGFPGENGEHIVLDYATSELALGKVREAMARGEPVKDGVLLDKHGQPTNDSRCLPPNDGALLPAAGHKGYSLALMCELIGAAVTGGYTIEPAHPRHDSIIVNSMTSLIFSPAKLAGAPNYE